MAKTTAWRRRKGIVLILLAAMISTVCFCFRPVYIAARKRADKIRLFTAIRRRDTAAVQNLLDGFADANARELPPDKRAFWRRCLDLLRGKHDPASIGACTPLQAAFLEEEESPPGEGLTEPTEIVRALIAHGANVNEKDEYGVSVVSLANTWSYESHAFDCVKLLLDHGADINAETRNGQSLLFDAIASNDMRTTELLLKRGAKCAMYGDSISMTGVARHYDASPEMLALLRPYAREK